MFKCFGSTALRAGCLMATAGLALSLPTASFAENFEYSGTACAAYNNAQADFLERNHVRIYNPPTSPSGLWVVCPIPRAYIQPSVAPTFAAVAYFDSTTPVGTVVRCIFREFLWSSLHVPGDNSVVGDNGLLNLVSRNIIRPASVPGVNVNIGTVAFNYQDWDTTYTVTCSLPPGTGLNFINVYK